MSIFDSQATFDEIRKRMNEIRAEEDAWRAKTEENWQTAENFVGGTPVVVPEPEHVMVDYYEGC